MEHAGAGGWSSEKKPDNPAKEHISPAQPWVRSMDDTTLTYYLHRETRRVNELHRALGVAEDLLQALEAEASKRNLDLF
jgi:hypothetical protein